MLSRAPNMRGMISNHALYVFTLQMLSKLHIDPILTYLYKCSSYASDPKPNLVCGGEAVHQNKSCNL